MLKQISPPTIPADLSGSAPGAAPWKFTSSSMMIRGSFTSAVFTQSVRIRSD